MVNMISPSLIDTCEMCNANQHTTDHHLPPSGSLTMIGFMAFLVLMCLVAAFGSATMLALSYRPKRHCSDADHRVMEAVRLHESMAALDSCLTWECDKGCLGGDQRAHERKLIELRSTIKAKEQAVAALGVWPIERLAV